MVTCEPLRQRQDRREEKHEEKRKGALLDEKGQGRNGQRSKEHRGRHKETEPRPSPFYVPATLLCTSDLLTLSFSQNPLN